LNTAIGNEVTRATNAEAALSTAISNEVTRATNAEGTLQTAINNEIAARIADVNTEETARIADVDAEESARIADVNAEESRALAAEGALQTELNTTQTGAGLNANGSYTAAGTPEGVVYINTATSLRSADLLLDYSLQNEKSQRQFADAANASAIASVQSGLAAEITARGAADTGLQAQIDSINLAAPGGPLWTEITAVANYFQNSGNTYNWRPHSRLCTEAQSTQAL